MKTVLKVDRIKFFGEAQLDMFDQDNLRGDMTRTAMVKQLKANMESRLTNVETRIAFIEIYNNAKADGEQELLRNLMGVTTRTIRNWKKDYEAYKAGTIKVRTVVIRK